MMFNRESEQIRREFRDPRYQPLDLTVQTGRLETKPQLYIAAMVPIVPVAHKTTAGPNHLIQVSNIRVRYTLNTRTETNVGSEARTFQDAGSRRLPVRGDDR